MLRAGPLARPRPEGGKVTTLNSSRPQIPKDALRVRVPSLRGDCPLTLAQAVVYGRLAPLKRPVSVTTLSRMFGGLFNDRKRLSLSLKQLSVHGLARAEDKKWLALESKGATREWFVWPDKLAEADKWHHKFAYWSMPLPEEKPFPESRVLLNDWAVYWWLLGWTARKKLPSIARAAALLGLSRNGWSAARNRLQRHGLLTLHGPLPREYKGPLVSRAKGDGDAGKPAATDEAVPRETTEREPWKDDLKVALAGVPSKLKKEIIHAAFKLGIWEADLVAYCRTALEDHKPGPDRPAHHGHLIMHRLKERQQHKEAKAEVKATKMRESLNDMVSSGRAATVKHLAQKCRTTAEEVYKVVGEYGWDAVEMASLPYSATLEQLIDACRERDVIEKFARRYTGDKQDIWRLAQEFGWDRVRAAVMSISTLIYPGNFKAVLGSGGETAVRTVGQLGQPNGAS